MEASYWVLQNEEMVERAHKARWQSTEVEHGPQRNLKLEGSQTWRNYQGLVRSLTKGGYNEEKTLEGAPRGVQKFVIKSY